MQTALFEYDLPQHLIAQQPAEPRDSSRLLVLQRATGAIEHRRFGDLPEYLRAGDLLVANDSRVIPARLHGHKASGGALEILLLKQVDAEGAEWECLIRGRGLRAGSRITVGELQAEVTLAEESGLRRVRFSAPVRPWLDELGEVPLPPYIAAWHGDPERYQTVYGRPEGSAAAPTAGLHFTPELLHDLRERGIDLETVTLHIGLDTFKPVEAERVEEHRIHSEWAQLGEATARRINETTLRGGRVVGVGTTSVRTLEWAATAAQGVDPWVEPDACPWKRVSAFAASVDLFIRPGYKFRALDMLVTNFHLPRSSLLMLVSAFIGAVHADPDAGRRMLLESYEEAKREGYRFFSFGDAMIIV